MEKFSAIIVAAGNSSRMGEATPKPYLPLGAAVVLSVSVSRFMAYTCCAEVICVINPEHEDVFKSHFPDINYVYGGDSRGLSVLNGLKEALSDVVLIHDAARPFVTSKVIDDLLNAIEQNNVDCAIPVLPCVDTVVDLNGGFVDRSKILKVQTPQAFSKKALFEAYEKHGTNETDDAGLIRLNEGTVSHVEGDERLFKLTTINDYERAKLVMNTQTKTCIGQGFDVHGFEAGDAVMLGGLKIPHTHKLKGHSDADVALHALTDALLGAVGAGDIGDHFPPSDKQWRGASSDVFVKEAVRLMKERGGAINNVDLTLICEAPKIGPHKQAITQHIAKLLGIDALFVNIKATTTEKLGFTGRGEGIACQAVVSVDVSS